MGGVENITNHTAKSLSARRAATASLRTLPWNPLTAVNMAIIDAPHTSNIHTTYLRKLSFHISLTPLRFVDLGFELGFELLLSRVLRTGDEAVVFWDVDVEVACISRDGETCREWRKTSSTAVSG